MGKHLQTAAAMACMKSLLMIFNFIFWISGIIILAIGIWMEVELYKFMEISTEFSATAPNVLIGTGAAIIILGTLACCCTIKGQTVLLYIYGGFLAMICLMELGAGLSIFAYRTKLATGFDNGLNQSMIHYRTESREKIANLDSMQRTLHCCGNHQSTDWLNLPKPMDIPQSCCKKENCDTTDDEQIYTQGCYEKVIELLDANIAIVAGAAIGIAFFPLLGVFLSCCLANSIDKARYEQMA